MVSGCAANPTGTYSSTYVLARAADALLVPLLLELLDVDAATQTTEPIDRNGNQLLWVGVRTLGLQSTKIHAADRRDALNHDVHSTFKHGFVPIRTRLDYITTPGGQ